MRGADKELWVGTQERQALLPVGVRADRVSVKEVGGDADWCNYCGKLYRGSLKN